jgi:hypothetical protein
LTRALFLQAAGLTNKQRHIGSRRLERGPVMFDLARDVVAGLIAAIHVCGRKRGAKTWMPATSAGRATARRFDLIGTRSKARSRQVLGTDGFSEPVRHISDISTCPNRTMPLQKFFDAGTVADDRELIISVRLCLATARANKVI